MKKLFLIPPATDKPAEITWYKINDEKNNIDNWSGNDAVWLFPASGSRAAFRLSILYDWR
jgi:hypothetical protein